MCPVSSFQPTMPGNGRTAVSGLFSAAGISQAICQNKKAYVMVRHRPVLYLRVMTLYLRVMTCSSRAPEGSEIGMTAGKLFCV